MEEKQEIVEKEDYQIEMTQENFHKLFTELKRAHKNGLGAGYIFDGKNFIEIVRRDELEKIPDTKYINAQKEEVIKKD